MHPQRNLIQIAEAIGDELYYDSRRPSERGDPEKRKSAELDDMQKSMLMPKANEPGPIQPGNEPITVGHLRQAAKSLPTNHPLMQSLGKKLGRLGDHVTAIKGADPFYLIHDNIKNAVNVHRLSMTPQREPVRKELNNSVEYNTEERNNSMNQNTHRNLIETAMNIPLNEEQEGDIHNHLRTEISKEYGINPDHKDWSKIKPHADIKKYANAVYDQFPDQIINKYVSDSDSAYDGDAYTDDHQDEPLKDFRDFVSGVHYGYHNR